MRARWLWLVLAALLAAPAVAGASRVALASAFLVEFLSEGRLRPLSSWTSLPDVRRLTAGRPEPPAPVDLYVRRGLPRPAGLVLVHGITEHGKGDPRLIAAAELLARAGWAVAVPTVRGLTELRLRTEDARAVTASIDLLTTAGYRPVALLAVSLGAAPAVLAAVPGGRDGARVSAVLLLGGYASARELLRYTLTGAYAFGPERGRRPTDEASIALFARANPELVDARGRRLVDNRDPAAVDGLLAALSPEAQRLLTELSPETHIGRLAAPLYLIHGVDDPVVPFTESLRLADVGRDAGRRVRVALAGSVGHVESGPRNRPTELWQLWATWYAFWLDSARPPD
ncbi:MAG: hypothetical protein L0027_04640 [Candidatus Rokubacteria bacterium]|nr:hypothetical protein [Candidatus Rokubacteria bacterium]